MPDNIQQTGGGGRGNSALALIVGALAVAVIIGAFFWFSGDTGDTVTMDQPDVTVEQEAPSADAPAATEEPAGTETTPPASGGGTTSD